MNNKVYYSGRVVSVFDDYFVIAGPGSEIAVTSVQTEVRENFSVLAKDVLVTVTGHISGGRDGRALIEAHSVRVVEIKMRLL